MTLRRAPGVSADERVMAVIAMALVVVFMGAWAWGVVLYVAAGNIAGAIGAILVLPVGALHAFGVL